MEAPNNWKRFQKVADRAKGLVGAYSFNEDGECCVSWLESPEMEDWDYEEVFRNEDDAIFTILAKIIA